MPDLNRLANMRRFFDSGATRSRDFRKEQLKKLQAAVQQAELPLQQALYADLKKNPEESWITETGFLLNEIRDQLKHLRNRMSAETVSTNLLNIPSQSYIVPEPLGVILIIAPWNYPLQLLFTPLAGAIAAGNCVVLKASEFAPATALVMKKLVEDNFPPEYISFTDEDGATVIPAMMNGFRFDHVFYTGSTAVGKVIYKMAAEQLVPVTLELGGKSPCVVEADANITVAAKRIAMAKFSNAGQMCIAPDYVLVHRSKKTELVTELGKALRRFFGEDASKSDEYGKIINVKQFDRLSACLDGQQLLMGGQRNKEQLYIEPTLVDEPAPGTFLMEEEIFGPLLPVVGFDTADEAKAIIARHPNPLAMYIFTGSKKKAEQWLTDVPFGGGCINNTALHFTNHNLPFGGRGFSGTGQYHGKFSFDTFSHKKAVLKSPNWFDPAIKYPPFKGKLRLLKWLTR